MKPEPFQLRPAVFPLRRLLVCLVLIHLGLPALAQRGRIESGEITSAALGNNLFGDKPSRPFKVYLPPGYDTSDRRFPVVYVLHGYLQNESTLIPSGPFVAAGMQPTLDSMIARGTINEMIAVFVNGTNRLNGSFYLNSPVIGDYETYIAKDLVRLIDDRYRTLPSRDSRGLAGFSMGGWGAMHLGLKFPEVFSVVVAESGFYDSRASWAEGLTRQLINSRATNLSQFASVSFPANVFQALFAGLLPNPQRPALFSDYPVALIQGKWTQLEADHQRCLDGDVQHGDLSRYLGQPARLRGIRLVHGTSDNIVPISETRQFTNALGKASIPFSYEQHPGDHTFRADLALPFLSSLLAVEDSLTSVERARLFVERSGPGELSVTIMGPRRQRYRLESSPDLMAWTSAGSVTITNTDGTVRILQPLPADRDRLFFRAAAD